MRIFSFALAATLFFSSCKDKKESPGPVEPVIKKDSTGVTGMVADPANDSVLIRRTKEAMEAFKQKDYAAIAALVHPVNGVRFSPYAYIDSSTDKTVTADWIRMQSKKPEKMVWGNEDASGKTINLTLAGYLDRYVYDVDFVNPEKLKVNEIIGAGTTANNLKQVYPHSNFTESHFSGFDKKYDGMDWKSLRLVFTLKDGIYYLVGVVHDEWTT